MARFTVDLTLHFGKAFMLCYLIRYIDKMVVYTLQIFFFFFFKFKEAGHQEISILP